MTQEITTSDMSRFGSRERAMAEELLKAWRIQGLPDDFQDDEVVITMNTHSGNVFLTNSEFQVAMMNGDLDDKGKLESFYSCPQCGNEGFAEEIKDGDACCKTYLREVQGEDDD
jgi:hypothetical protein